VSPSFICLLLPSLCAHTEENLETASDLVLSQEDKLQTHSTVHEISRETGRPIHRLSLSRIICKDLHQKCFKRRCAQELTDTNCAARTKRTKLQLQTFRSMPPTFTDENMFSVISSDNWQNRVSGRLRELLKKKLSVLVGTVKD